MGLIAGLVAQPIVRPVVGGWRTLSRRFADILKGRTAIIYDPQDLPTMYQDPNGTLPVYRPGSGAVDPPVGLLLDKSMGLELGPELVVNGDFSDGTAGWTSAQALTVTESNELEFAGDADALWDQVDSTPFSVDTNKKYIASCTVRSEVSEVSSLVLIQGGGNSYVQQVYGTTNQTHTFIFTPIASSVFFVIARGATVTTTKGWLSNVSVREIKGYHAYQTTPTARPKLSGLYNLLTATETLSTQSVTTAATDYTLRFEGTGTVTLSGTATGVLSAGTHTITCTAGTLTLTVAGSVTRADLRVKRDGSNLPPYQRVDSATTYDTVGFQLYLKRDKTDDDLIVQAPAITGLRAWGSIDTVDIAAATIAAGSHQPFGAINAGEPTCTQWIAIDGALTAVEQAVLERYVYSKSKLLVGV